jgi:hypothetical protein
VRRNVPAGDIAAADVRHFALANQLLHRLPDLVPRRAPIDVVHLVEIDVVGLQPPKAGLARSADVIGGETAIVRPGAHRLVQLRSENDAIATATILSEPAADDLLRDAETLLHVRTLWSAIDVGRVEEVDAGFERRVHDLEAGGFAGQLPEVHGAERQPADLQARAAQRCVLHRIPHSPTDAGAS